MDRVIQARTHRREGHFNRRIHVQIVLGTVSGKCGATKLAKATQVLPCAVALAANRRSFQQLSCRRSYTWTGQRRFAPAYSFLWRPWEADCAPIPKLGQSRSGYAWAGSVRQNQWDLRLCDSVACQCWSQTRLPLQNVAPARHAPIIGVGIVPIAGFMSVASCCDGRAGRHADRARHIGVLKHRSARGQTVKVWRLHNGMAQKRKRARLMFICHDEQDVSRSSHQIPLHESHCHRIVNQTLRLLRYKNNKNVAYATWSKK